MRSWKADKARGSQPGTRVGAGKDFFIWIRCNPLKSPDSAKEIQAFFLGFIWLYWDLFGRNSPLGCIYSGQSDRTDPFPLSNGRERRLDQLDPIDHAIGQ